MPFLEEVCCKNCLDIIGKMTDNESFFWNFLKSFNCRPLLLPSCCLEGSLTAYVQSIVSTVLSNPRHTIIYIQVRNVVDKWICNILFVCIVQLFIIIINKNSARHENDEKMSYLRKKLIVRQYQLHVTFKRPSVEWHFNKN